MVSRALLGLFLAVGACKRGGQADARGADGVFAVEVASIEGPAAGSRSRAGDWARREADQVFRAAEVFDPAADRPSQAALRADVVYTEIRTRAGQVLRLQVELERPESLEAALAELEATVELEREDGRVELQRDVPVALERAVAVLEAKVRLARGGVEATRKLLNSEDPELVLLALGWATTHRHRESADIVVQLLSHEDERVELAAVECLGQIGAAEHVHDLVVSARLANRAHTGRLYEALAELGGAEAEGFLDFAARNEDDPALAEVAQRSLSRLLLNPGLTAAATPPPDFARGHR